MSTFGNLLGRLNYLSEARGEGKGLKIRSIFPHLAGVHKQASAIAKQTHPNVFSRYAKNSVLTVIDLVLDTDFTSQFKNADQNEVIRYWQETPDEDGVSYAKKVAAITPDQIDAAIKARGITGEGRLEDIVNTLINNLYIGRDNSGADKRAQQATAFAERPAATRGSANAGATISVDDIMGMLQNLETSTKEIAASSNNLASAAYDTGDQQLGNTISNIGDTALRSNERILVQISVYKMLIEIYNALGDPGVDVDEAALQQIVKIVPKLNNLDSLKSLIRQISPLEEYQVIATYLSNAIKPIKAGIVDMQGSVEEEEVGVEEYYDEEKDPSQLGHHEIVMSGRIPWVIMYNNEGKVVSVSTEHYDGRDAHVDVEHVNAYLDRGFPIGRAIGAATSYPSLSDEHNGGEDGMMMGESASPILNYMSEIRMFSSPKPVVESIGFREKYKPKTSKQLAELKSYGM